MSRTTQAAYRAGLKQALLSNTRVQDENVQVLLGEHPNSEEGTLIVIGRSETGENQPSALRRTPFVIRDESYLVFVLCVASGRATPEEAEYDAVTLSEIVEETVHATANQDIGGINSAYVAGEDIETVDTGAGNECALVLRVQVRARRE